MCALESIDTRMDTAAVAVSGYGCTVALLSVVTVVILKFTTCGRGCKVEKFLILKTYGTRVGTPVSQEQMSNDLVSLLVSSCLSVWSGYVRTCTCSPSIDFQVSERFQVPSSKNLKAVRGETPITALCSEVTTPATASSVGVRAHR
jgi:hypothetical protein